NHICVCHTAVGRRPRAATRDGRAETGRADLCRTPESSGCRTGESPTATGTRLLAPARERRVDCRRKKRRRTEWPGRRTEAVGGAEQYCGSNRFFSAPATPG